MREGGWSHSPEWIPSNEIRDLSGEKGGTQGGIAERTRAELSLAEGARAANQAGST